MNDMTPIDHQLISVPDFKDVDPDRTIVRLARDPDTGKLQAFSAFWSQLPALQAQHARVDFDVADPDDYKAARSYVYRLRMCKGSVERVRKAEKSAITAAGREIDSEAKELSGEIEGMMGTWTQRIEAHDAAEETRIAGHRAVLDQIEQLGRIDLMEITEAALVNRIERLTEIDPAGMEEFAAAAAEARQVTLARLHEAAETVQRRDAEREELRELREMRKQIEAERAAQEREAEKAERAAALEASREAHTAAESDQVAQGVMAPPITPQDWLRDTLLHTVAMCRISDDVQATCDDLAERYVRDVEAGRTPFSIR